MSELTHLDDEGAARMVDVGGKKPTRRRAVAEAFVAMSAETLGLVTDDALPKGDALATARIAGIMAAKRTPDLIPLCHPVQLSHVAVDIAPSGEPTGLAVTATCETVGRTGVEMEALVAASAASLTIYDMCKAVERGITIEGVRLVSKSGGASGTWERERP